ncbi:hypothetical protein STEG23_013323, partial [Scotinomys teguina]
MENDAGNKKVSKSWNREVHAPHHTVTQLIGCGIRPASKSPNTQHMRPQGWGHAAPQSFTI